MLPSVAGAYILDEVIGRGGMGVVYAARQTSLGRSVALKLMNPEFATDPSLVERFRIEALAAGRIEHPNVVYVIDRGTTEDGQPYLVMERVVGDRLGAILECAGRLSARRAGLLVLQVLAALEATHHAGVVHADVKCDNLLVDTTAEVEHVTLIDFGIARLVERPDPRDLDRGERMLSGTPEYLAPELICGGVPTIASDLYAVGVVLYELLTGAPPFRGASADETFRQHLDEAPVPPSLRCPEAQLSPALDRILVHALAKEPTKRFSSAAAFATALRAALPATGLDVHVTIAPTFSPEAPTQNWPHTMRRRLADGTAPLPQAQGGLLATLRTAVGTAIHDGDRDEIATAYLELARAYVTEDRADRAAAELEEGIAVVAGVDERDEPPKALWRLELALASIYDDLGDADRARVIATRARRDAIRAHSEVGRDRARVLLRRLVHDVAV